MGGSCRSGTTLSSTLARLARELTWWYSRWTILQTVVHTEIGGLHIMTKMKMVSWLRRYHIIRTRLLSLLESHTHPGRNSCEFDLPQTPRQKCRNAQCSLDLVVLCSGQPVTETPMNPFKLLPAYSDPASRLSFTTPAIFLPIS